MAALDIGDPLEDREWLRRVLDRLPALVAFWDRDRHNVIANQAYVDWFGFTPEQMRGLHISEVLGDEVYALNLPYIDGVLQGHEQHFDRTLVDPTGRVRHSQADYIPEFGDDGVIGFTVLVTDATAKVEAQRQLDQAQAVSLVGSWAYNVQNEELLWSREMFRIIGADPDHDVPSLALWQSRIVPEDREWTVALREEAIARREPYDMHYRMRMPDGTLRYVRSRGGPMRDTQGEVSRMVGTIQDETDIRMTTKALEASNARLSSANQLLSDTVAMLGHDVQQPIQATNGFLELTLDAWEALPDDQRRENVERALRSGVRLRGLVQDILTLMHVESGKITVRPRDVTLRDLVSEAVDAVAPDDARIEVDIDRSVVVHTDPFHLRQVVSNLLGNSLKYGEPPVRISAQDEGDTVRMWVSDHGEGVSPEFVDRLFDRFARQESTANPQPSGSGFGLYIAKALVDANGGTIAYESDFSRGATFAITLPGPTE